MTTKTQLFIDIIKANSNPIRITYASLGILSLFMWAIGYNIAFLYGFLLSFIAVLIGVPR